MGAIFSPPKPPRPPAPPAIPQETLDLQKAQVRKVQLELRAAIAAVKLRRVSGGAAANFKTKTTTQKQ